MALPVPPDSFAGRVVLLTSADDAVGIALAETFRAAGALIAVLADEPAGEGAQADLRLQTPPVDPVAVATAFDAIESRLGGVDLLINHRPRKHRRAAEDIDWRQWRSAQAAILDSGFLYTTEFARRRIAAGQGGDVLMIADSFTVGGGAGSSASAAAEAGLANLVQSWTVEWLFDDIRINMIETGLVADRDDPAFDLARERGMTAADSVPLKRLGTPQEIAWAALFLASDFASYIAGATLRVDGGEWLRAGLGGDRFASPRRWTRDRLKVGGKRRRSG